MKKISTILILILSNLIVIELSLADCLIPTAKGVETEYCSDSPIVEYATIDALTFTTLDSGILHVGGGVCLSMGKQKISTDELFYDEKKQLININSPLVYYDGKQTINAQRANVNMEKETADLSEVYFQQDGAKANGSAGTFKSDKKTSHLTALTYTTCPQNDQQWFIKAEVADLDQENQIGTFRKMTLQFKGVPLFYLPYAKLPLNNQRLSGFLIPEIGNSSTNGFNLAVPYYFNISENMDATIIPRIISKRGAMLGGEYRYLNENFAGEIYANYLPSDKLENIDRGFAEIKHRHKLSNNWSLNSRLRHVSDNEYFEDFGHNVSTTSQAYLYSFLNLNGYGDNWLFKGTFNEYQIISDNISLAREPYQTLPSLDFSWFNNDYTSSLDYGVDSNWTHFYKEQSITSSRLDLMPYVEKTFQNSYSRITPRLAYRYTNWDYSNENFSSIVDLSKSRALPILSLDYSVNFEKQFSDGSFSSLEPRLFYLNVPYENQQNIPLFDSHELTYGSSLLYQTNAFSGADRQSDANQLSVGLSQRHFDKNGAEKWNLTLGQIVYFDDRRVQLDSSVETRHTSPIITEFNYFYRNWRATMSLHWDTEIDKSERALLKFQHKGDNNSLFNFAYRFRRGKIEQLDSSVVLPIGVNNRLIARWNYSLDERKTIEAIAGFEHKNCCWAMRVVGRRFVYNEAGDVNNGLFFELQLNGLGSIGRNPRRLLKQSILGYTEEF
jgi:LPS-assembly protein